MEIQPIAGQEWSDLNSAAEARDTHVLIVVPHCLAFSGVGYVMWGPRPMDSPMSAPVTVASLLEIRAVDLSLVASWPSDHSERPIADGLMGPEQIEAKTLLADEAFWADATSEQDALRLAVRGLLTQPQAQAARAAYDAMFVRGIAPEPEDSAVDGKMSSRDLGVPSTMRIPPADATCAYVAAICGIAVTNFR